MSSVGRVITSFDPRTGAVNGTVVESTPQDVADAVARAAAVAPAVAAASPAERRRWLGAVADALEADLDALVDLADRETALGRPRLEGEVRRTAGQLRFYADVAVEGSYLAATIDHARDAQPFLARVNRPIGPVAVFGASNFPFAFSMLGNDFGSALAAGCPVVAKAHSAHALLSERLAELAHAALATAGAPAGTFGAVAGLAAGTDLATAPGIAAIAFTGSQAGGLALWRLANERQNVIPVFAEMGTVNPVVLTSGAAERVSQIAEGLVGSFTLGSGQFCTKPGLVFAPSGCGAAEVVARALHAAGPQPVMLTEAIAANARAGIDALVAAGAEVVAVVGAGEGGLDTPARSSRALDHRRSSAGALDGDGGEGGLDTPARSSRALDHRNTSSRALRGDGGEGGLDTPARSSRALDHRNTDQRDEDGAVGYRIESGWAAPAAVLAVPIEALQPGTRLLEECFGAVVLVAEYEDDAALAAALDNLQGALAASVMTDGSGADPDAGRWVDQLAGKVGRVAVDDWPTGVAFTWAQHHGGPWPSTTDPRSTSVGAAALDRFVRPVTYQSVADADLPAALQAANPWRLPRRIDGVPAAAGER